MKTPTATYRLQFRGDMDFAAAVEIVPYLKQLGISHLYASPIFTATGGSTHGYDVTDHNEIDPVLGGREGFDRLCDALRAAGLGLILDIVPNHMAASMENPWWRDVVEWGAQSRFAGHFDIDWSRKLTLPILGKPFDEAVAAGEISVVLDDDLGSLVLAYFENHIPLHPASWEQVLARMEDPAATFLAEAAGRSDPKDPQWLREQVGATKVSTRFADELASLSRDHAFLASMHEEQQWELMFWKEARRTLSSRRFFEITGLAGVRVEDRAVFDDVHRLTLELVASGQVDGLRVDHVDGLADPAGYLRMLREAAGPDTYIVVEKILAPGEELPADWPIEGTTGYEFIDATVDLLADAGGLERLSRAYEAFTGASPLELSRRKAKTEILTVNFEGELTRLTETLVTIAEGQFTYEELRAGLVALIVAMPVYRTYVGEGRSGNADRAALDEAFAEAREQNPEVPAAVLEFIDTVFAGDDRPGDETRRARQLFQQLSSPAMAKGVEDTLFYRDHRLLALNEVGCEPDRPAPWLARFHDGMKRRQESFPLSLSGTATHDTKRGEDARARLLALTAEPEIWAGLMVRWCAANAHLLRHVDGRPVPDPEVEWMIYQALMAAWPEELDTDDGNGIAALRERFLAFLTKAMREAKLRTTWTHIDEDFEGAVSAYAEGILEPGSTFLSDFVRDTEPFRVAGRSNSLSQLLVKMTAPGIPDIYQGTEIGDFSLVDPDNRRPVDFSRLQAHLTAAETPATFAEWKTRILSVGLEARRDHIDLFSNGEYRPLDISGTGSAKVLAFARVEGRDAAIVVVPRLLTPAEASKAEWGDTIIHLPASLASRPFRERLSGRSVRTSLDMGVGDILAGLPGALLISD